MTAGGIFDWTQSRVACRGQRDNMSCVGTCMEIQKRGPQTLWFLLHGIEIPPLSCQLCRGAGIVVLFRKTLMAQGFLTAVIQRLCRQSGTR